MGHQKLVDFVGMMIRQWVPWGTMGHLIFKAILKEIQPGHVALSHHLSVESCGSRLIGVHFLPLHTCSSLLSPGPKLHPSKFHIWPDIVPGFSAYQIHIVLCFKHITILFGRIAGG